MRHSMLTQTDSYKVSHWKQYPPGTENVYSYFESRSDPTNKIVFFGLQYILNEFFYGSVVWEDDLDETEEIYNKHFGANIFNREGWQYIIDKYDGKLPLSIRAVPEGTVVPAGNVLMVVENTDSKVPWLTNWVETLLSQVWYPCTVATESREMKFILRKYQEKHGADPFIDFKLHDFGYRGSTSSESAGIGGAAHLVNFQGTDTLEGIMLLRDYYEAEMAGFSIPAAEHSTITSWGKNNERDAYANMLEQFPTGLVAVVSDSYDIFNACEQIWGTDLKNAVTNRNGTLVVRPDSGDPPVVVCEVLRILGEKFGYTLNDKGYKVLPDYIRVIQGDGIDSNMLDIVLAYMTQAGWSMDNIAFGSGGGLLQKVNRDTFKFAFKCSDIRVNGKHRGVFKDPVTDTGKRSKSGRLALIKSNKGYETIPEADAYGGTDLLVEVFNNGNIMVEYTLDEIRERAKV